MKKLILLIALALPALLTAQQRDWANYGRYAEANAQLTTPPAVVFMGNSITDGWDNAHPEFFTANNFACRGIGGQVTGQMLCRFRADVINLHPQAVVILAGTNDHGADRSARAGALLSRGRKVNPRFRQTEKSPSRGDFFIPEVVFHE